MKLEEEGFEDAEKDEKYLKEWHSHYFQARYSPDTFEAKRAYFSTAEKFLQNLKTWECIWSLHTEGLSYREISAALAKRGVNYNKDKVNLTITTLKDIMKTHLFGEEDFEPRRHKRDHRSTCIPPLGFQLSIFDMA